MAHVEETIERIKAKPSVESFVICNPQPAGPILRRSPATSEERAEALAQAMRPLAAKAQGVIRDLDPTNELEYLRIKTRKHELMMAVDDHFLAIVMQRWAPTGGSGGGGGGAAGGAGTAAAV